MELYFKWTQHLIDTECKLGLLRSFDFNITEVKDDKAFKPKEQGGTAEFQGEVYGIYGKL